MNAAVALLALTAAGVAVAALARRWELSAPLLLTLTGIAASFVPALPPVHVDPEVILLGLLPPLLYGAAIRTSLLELGSNRRNIGLLSVALVVLTAVVVGLVVWRLLDVPLALAIAFGGVVAPPDAVAATAIARRIGLPRRIVTILEGESLFNDATALVIVRTGVLALGAAVTLGQVTVGFLWAAGGGVLAGVIVAKLVNAVRRRLTDTTTDTALSFMVPWLAYLPAEAAHCSGVLAVVVAGVLLGHSAPVAQTAVSRMSERINWNTVEFLLQNAVFLLIGLQAKGIVEDVSATRELVPDRGRRTGGPGHGRGGSTAVHHPAQSARPARGRANPRPAQGRSGGVVGGDARRRDPGCGVHPPLGRSPTQRPRAHRPRGHHRHAGVPRLLPALGGPDGWISTVRTPERTSCRRPP